MVNNSTEISAARLAFACAFVRFLWNPGCFDVGIVYCANVDAVAAAMELAAVLVAAAVRIVEAAAVEVDVATAAASPQLEPRGLDLHHQE
jgi:hypothetical protein